MSNINGGMVEASAVQVGGLIDRCKEIQGQQSMALQFLGKVLGTEEEQHADPGAHCTMDELAAAIDCIQFDASKIRRAVEEINRQISG